MVGFSLDTFNKMQDYQDTYTGGTELVEEGSTNLDFLEALNLELGGTLSSTMQDYGFMPPGDYEHGDIPGMELSDLVHYFALDSGIVQEGEEIDSLWYDQFLEKYSYLGLSQFDMTELDAINEQYQTSQDNVISGYNTWYGELGIREDGTVGWSGARGVHDMEKANLEAKHDRDMGNLTRQLEKGTKDYQRQKSEALSRSMQTARTAESQLGRGGIAVGGGEFGLSRQNVMGQIEDEFDLMSQEYDKLKTEVDLQMENLEASFADSISLADASFEQIVETQMAGVFDELETMGIEYDQAYTGAIDDYWDNMFSIFAGITSGDLGGSGNWGQWDAWDPIDEGDS